MRLFQTMITVCTLTIGLSSMLTDSADAAGLADKQKTAALQPARKKTAVSAWQCQKRRREAIRAGCHIDEAGPPSGSLDLEVDRDENRLQELDLHERANSSRGNGCQIEERGRRRC